MIDKHANDKIMALLGFCAGNSPLVVEMAKDALGIQRFDVVKNIAVEIPEKFLDWKDIEIQVHTSENYSFKESEPEIHFGVLDAHVKYVLYHYFYINHGLGKNSYTNIIHPTAYFAGSSEHGQGFILDPLCVVSTKSSIGFGVTVKRSSSVGHHAEISDFVTINPGATVSGNVQIGEGTTIGAGAIINHNITIGKYSMIGSGSVVTKDIPDGVVAFGNPCRVVRKFERWDKSFDTVRSFRDSSIE